MGAVASRLTWRRLPALIEILSIAIGYGIYASTRVLVQAPNRVHEAYAHAHQVVHLETVLGIYHEHALNVFISGKEWLEIPASYYYATLHFIITPLVLAWLWRRHRNIYAPLRSALVIATAAALVVYATWPLAPPRYITPHSVDVVLDHPVFWAPGHGASGFVNELAAMPSLHVGWAVWCAVSVTTALRTRWRFAAWLYPIGTTLVVISTANHYVLDVLGGAFTVTVALYLCGVRFSGRVLRTVIAHPPVSESAGPKEKAAA